MAPCHFNGAVALILDPDPGPIRYQYRKSNLSYFQTTESLVQILSRDKVLRYCGQTVNLFQNHYPKRTVGLYSTPTLIPSLTQAVDIEIVVKVSLTGQFCP